jgi:nitrate/nitrite-specific signal transduction histidine kinase
MQPRLKTFAKRLFRWSQKWRWVILAIIGLSLLWVEVQEFLVLRVLNQAFHYFEVFQYAVLLIATGTLIELYARSNHAHRQSLKILRYKHALSMELTANEDWELLTAKLAELPSRITSVEEAYLLIGNPISEKFEIVSHWENPSSALNHGEWDPTVPCQTCLENATEKKINFHLCHNDHDTSSFRAYSLAVVDRDSNVAVLKFKLIPGVQLVNEEQELLLNIGDEIAASLRASRNRRRISELQTAQVALAERRLVSAYVHDQLGQNLGYLHLRLDQLGNDQSLGKSQRLRSELGQLQSVANESYEIVRDILKRLQPHTIPHITNILQEHARKISHRADFSLRFRSVGRQVGLLPEAQQLILYIFYEIFNNIEKHARANDVAVSIVWRKGCLDIAIADDGIGFETHKTHEDDHYGLKILQERIERLDGCLAIDSSMDNGTKIGFSIPLEQIMEAK